MDETLEHSNLKRTDSTARRTGHRFETSAVLIFLAAAVFFGCIVSPPSLMDDVDAVQAQIARNMLDSGDWVIAHLDGVPYLEKSPVIYWMIAISFRIFGVHDWAARIPVALAAVLLAWVTYRYGRWAFEERAGYYAGVVLATCVGLFLFTRIQIPDVMLTLSVCLAFWAFQRATDPEETHSNHWAAVLAASLAVGVMLKGLIALVIPAGGIFVYLVLTRQLFSREVWKRLHVVSGAAIFLLIATPWHVLATLRMPPYLDFTMHSGPGEYHGFFWFYFMNEHVLRFLNLRYPRDYNTVPRLAFWGLHLVWLFPWSVYFPAAARLDFKPRDRAGKTRLLALCWTLFLLIFFTFSTTQEYYSMPIYPALALLLGSAMARNDSWALWGTRVLGLISAVCAVCVAILLVLVRGMAAPGDISRALEQHPEAYTLSMGHMGDLTLHSFAYLRLPLVLAGVAFLVGAFACWMVRGPRVYLAIALMMVLFIHASRAALVVFDPYLSSRPLAEALLRAPKGELIINGAYYAFSSVFFYTGRNALLWNGRFDNLEYGSYAPGSAPVFIDDHQFQSLWNSGERYFVLSDGERRSHLQQSADSSRLFLVMESGGKTLYSNLPVNQ
ncbi:MAG TPA: glycosyltransferase family 39 protein [Candidatus Acidoferrales bacterium]|nr:glycosyltransferase family 39 protein [Candidatus Acidoferrales bacterium]